MPSNKILVVDDEESICLSIQVDLSAKGFDVETALSGEQAVEKLENNPSFDLVITDLRMGGLSGVDVFKKAMGRSGDVSVDETQDEMPLVQFGEQLPTLRQTVKQLLMEAMQRAQGNQTMMATMLGISRPALSKRLKNLREKEESE